MCGSPNHIRGGRDRQPMCEQIKAISDSDGRLRRARLSIYCVIIGRVGVRRATRSFSKFSLFLFAAVSRSSSLSHPPYNKLSCWKASPYINAKVKNALFRAKLIRTLGVADRRSLTFKGISRTFFILQSRRPKIFIPAKNTFTSYGLSRFCLKFCWTEKKIIFH